MGSKAFQAFVDNAEDIKSMVALYDGVLDMFKEYEADPPPDMDVLFASAAVLMVSHWEAYIEDIVGEALAHLVKHASAANVLPKEIKKIIASEIKADANEISMWQLADDGWRKLLGARLDSLKAMRDGRFNSPKSAQTIEFIKKALGIEDISTAWEIGNSTPAAVRKKLDALVVIRGHIAHRGRLGVKIDKDWVIEHSEFVQKLASKTGGRINRHLRDITGKPLWE